MRDVSGVVVLREFRILRTRTMDDYLTLGAKGVDGVFEEHSPQPLAANKRRFW